MRGSTRSPSEPTAPGPRWRFRATFRVETAGPLRHGLGSREIAELPTVLLGVRHRESRSSRALLDPFQQRASCGARSPLWSLIVVTLCSGRGGDVEMGPRDALAHVLAQEERGDDRAAGAGAGVLVIGDLGIELGEIVVVQ